MIKRINRIKNLAVFHDFLWRGGIPDFSKINLIYGYNYSGKTSLSRLFSSLRDKRLHEDYPHMEFELQLQDGDRISHREISDFPLSVLVFNRDYLDKQLRISSKTEWDGIAFDLGQNADTRGLIEEVETGIKLNKDEEGKHKGIIAEFQKFENEEFTAWGIDVRKKVYNKTENYDKRDIKKTLNDIGYELDKHIIGGSKARESLHELEVSSTAKNVYIKLDSVSYTSKLDGFVVILKSILAQEPAKDIIIEELDSNADLYKWVLEGLTIELNHEVCSYCGNVVTPVRLKQLHQYFNNASAKLRTLISELKQDIETEINDASYIKHPSSKNDFVDSLQMSATECLSRYDEVIKQYKATLRSILPYLESKQKSIHVSLELPDEESFAETLSEWIEYINDLILKHNNFVDTFETQQKKARIKYEHHLVAKLIRDSDYYNKKHRNDKAVKDLEILLSQRRALEEQLNTLRASLRDITLGKKTLEDHIKGFLGREDISIEVTDDDKFILMRGDIPASNLSDGEKTIICLAYFFTFIEAQPDGVLKETIVFIDDPISSLDSNHVVQVFSKLIGIMFYKTKNDKEQETNANRFKQVFLSTHSFDFFDFLKREHRIKKAGRSMYMLNRTSEKKANLSDLPKPLKEYNSEYVYLFSLIKQYKDLCESGEIVLDLNMANALRRFLEIYTAMKLPHILGLNDRVQQFAEDFYDLPYLQRLSHFSSFDKLTRHDELIACLPQVCNAIWELLKKDEPHFQSLIKAVSKS